MSKRNIINLAIMVAVVAALFFLYRTFFGGSDGSPEAGSPGLVAESDLKNSQSSDEFLQILLSLQQIELQGDFFADPTFRGLRDFSRPLKLQTAGRNNPFAPIGSGGPPVAATTTTAVAGTES